MEKLLKKQAVDKRLRKKAIHAPAIVHDDNSMFHWVCDRTKDKFHTVVPHHNALQPASPTFLKNYDEIDWHREE